MAVHTFDLTANVKALTEAHESFMRALKAASLAMQTFHSAWLIALYPWNPLGTYDYGQNEQV